MRHLILLILVLSCSTMQAATVYIDCDGLNGDGLAGSPYNNFSDAIGDSSVVDGTANILYAKGTCAEAVNLTKGGQDTSNRLVIQNWTGNLILHGSGIADENGIDISPAKSYISIQSAGGYSFTIQNFERKGIICDSSSGNENTEIYLDGLTISNNGTDDLEYNVSSIDFDFVDYGKIENCVITDSSDEAIRIHNGDADSGDKWIIHNNTISGITIVGTSYFIHLKLDTHVSVTNNDIDIPAANGDIRGVFAIDSNNILVDNNTINSASITAGSDAVGIQFSDVHTSVISDNEVGQWGEDCYENDLDNGASYGITIERNLAYNCVNTNIEMADKIGTLVAPVIIRNNLSYITSASAGSRCYGHHSLNDASGSVVHWFNNTCYTNQTGRRCFFIGTNDSSLAMDELLVQNNICYVSNGYGLQIQGQTLFNSIGAGDIQNNSWYRADSGDVFNFIGSSTNTYTGVQIEAGAPYADYSIEPAAYHIATAPSFTSAPSDLSLTIGDDRIDAGATISSFSDDYEEISRPQDGVWDIGAYEYNSGILAPGGVMLMQ